jgi:hypothetical protein
MPSDARASLVWWLAQRALARRHGATIVRYGDVIADSSNVLAAILPGRPTRAHVATLEHAAALDENDLQAIRAICLQAAAELGVSERGS